MKNRLDWLRIDLSAYQHFLLPDKSWQVFPEDNDQLIEIDRLAQEIIHSRFKAFCAILGKRIGSQGDDRGARFSVSLLPLANGSGRPDLDRHFVGSAAQ